MRTAKILKYLAYGFIILGVSIASRFYYSSLLLAISILFSGLVICIVLRLIANLAQINYDNRADMFNLWEAIIEKSDRIITELLSIRIGLNEAKNESGKIIPKSEESLSLDKQENQRTEDNSEDKVVKLLENISQNSKDIKVFFEEIKSHLNPHN